MRLCTLESSLIMNVSIYTYERTVILTTYQDSSERQVDSGDGSLV